MWDDTDSGKSEYWKKSVFQCHFHSFISWRVLRRDYSLSKASPLLLSISASSHIPVPFLSLWLYIIAYVFFLVFPSLYLSFNKTNETIVSLFHFTSFHTLCRSACCSEVRGNNTGSHLISQCAVEPHKR